MSLRVALKPQLASLRDDLRPALRELPPHRIEEVLADLQDMLLARPGPRVRLVLRRLRFRGQARGDFRFHDGVNVLRAGNDKGKSSVLKLVQLCLTGKNELKRDVDRWISDVELEFELGGAPYRLELDKDGRLRGQLLLLSPQGDTGEPVVSFRNGKQMRDRLERFMNDALGLRPLRGTQKDSRKGSDQLLDSTTSYRAYFRGLHVDQEHGYNDLLTGGVAFGGLFTKILGMLLGIRGIDAYYEVEALLAHLQHELAQERRYRRRAGQEEQAKEDAAPRDLSTLDEEINRLETYIDELKVERSAAWVRATSGDLDQRLRDLTSKLLSIDAAELHKSRELHGLEGNRRQGEETLRSLEQALAGQRAMALLQPHSCPLCATPMASTPAPAEDDHCHLCHSHAPADVEEQTEALESRVSEARKQLAAGRQQEETLKGELAELGANARRLRQRKTQLATQLRSAFQGTEEIDREIELETRYLGRLEAERERATVTLDEDPQQGLRGLHERKRVLDALRRHLRTRAADTNERIKRAFGERVRAQCTHLGFPGLEAVTLDGRLQPRIRQNGEVYSFEELSPGEKVRFVLAFYLALALGPSEPDAELARGRHPGLLLVDSPGKEEMVSRDFEAVVELLRGVEEREAANLQVVVATTLPAIQRATEPAKQVFIENDDQGLFTTPQPAHTA